MKVLCVFGTRPEAIKMAPVIAALKQRPEHFDVRVCVTAQHREMLDSVLSLFGIRADYDLGVMRPNQTLAELTSRILVALDPVMGAERPDWVLVQGDTTTVMAASLLAYYCGVRVGHVEAGLRTHSKSQPFPEEINRRIAGVVADLHFAPTEIACRNLLREGVDPSTIYVTGNTVIDALLQIARHDFDCATAPWAGIPPGSRILLVTAHRRENFGPPLQAICRALRLIAERYAGQVHIVYPVHLNPNVRDPVSALLAGCPGITLLEPLDYLAFVHLMQQCYLVLTDSGGLQEEAPSLGKPVLVLRDVTERPEAVAAGTARLVGTDAGRILAEVAHLIDDPLAYSQMAGAINPYGDGHAAVRIADALISASTERAG